MNTTSETPGYDLESALRAEAESINAKAEAERVSGITQKTREEMVRFKVSTGQWPFSEPQENIVDEDGILLPMPKAVSSVRGEVWSTEDVKDRDFFLDDSLDHAEALSLK